MLALLALLTVAAPAAPLPTAARCSVSTAGAGDFVMRADGALFAAIYVSPPGGPAVATRVRVFRGDDCSEIATPFANGVTAMGQTFELVGGPVAITPQGAVGAIGHLHVRPGLVQPALLVWDGRATSPVRAIELPPELHHQDLLAAEGRGEQIVVVAAQGGEEALVHLVVVDARRGQRLRTVVTKLRALVALQPVPSRAELLALDRWGAIARISTKTWKVTMTPSRPGPRMHERCSVALVAGQPPLVCSRPATEGPPLSYRLGSVSVAHDVAVLVARETSAQDEVVPWALFRPGSTLPSEVTGPAFPRATSPCAVASPRRLLVCGFGQAQVVDFP